MPLLDSFNLNRQLRELQLDIEEYEYNYEYDEANIRREEFERYNSEFDDDPQYHNQNELFWKPIRTNPTLKDKKAKINDVHNTAVQHLLLLLLL